MQRLVVVAAAGLAAFAGAGCGSDAAGLDAGARLEVAVHGLRPIDAATEGMYELWAHPRTGAPISLGTVSIAGDPTIVTVELPSGDIASMSLTVEPPGDVSSDPSASVLMAGAIGASGGRMVIEKSVTDGRPLQPEPGHHSLFTSSNNVELGYPSFENSGLWLFSISVQVNKHRTREVKLTPLLRGWLYEGWIVRDFGTPGAIWISYGKFRPDPLSLLTSRDHTGSGLFSGDEDFVNGGVEDVPGDEWTTKRIAGTFGLDLPHGLDVPLALDAVDPATGEAVWSHVITIEPAFDETEPLTTERPFALRPYRNAIGAGSAALPRKILYQDNDPYAVVRAAP